jgi:SAM-dependent methyltransferase
MLDPARIGEIRAKLHAQGRHSWTTATFQNQLLSFIQLNAHRGDFVIEVGCARGGLTAQLAYLTDGLGKALYAVDVDQTMLDQAAQAVRESTGTIPDSTHFFRGDLRSFLSRPRMSDRCILAFIDGDHRYDGVIRDIRALVDSRLARPLSIAFHDFSLRYDDESLADVRVDRAIRDALRDETLMPIGELSGLSSLVTEPSSETLRAYYERGGSEGVLVTLATGAVAPATGVLGRFVGRLGRRSLALGHRGLRASRRLLAGRGAGKVGVR